MNSLHILTFENLYRSELRALLDVEWKDEADSREKDVKEETDRCSWQHEHEKGKEDEEKRGSGDPRLRWRCCQHIDIASEV
jgi:hypothetical protein